MALSARFREALVYAATLHTDQQRKVSGEPYLAHLMAVAALVMEHGGSEDEAIAALLHDAVEDQGGTATREEIARRFGSAVVEMVNGCTDTAETPKPPWRARKEAYLTRVGNASASVRLIVAADRLHNVQALLREYRRQGEVVWTFFNGGRKGTLWYYRSIVEALRKNASEAILAELDRAVRELERACVDDESHAC